MRVSWRPTALAISLALTGALALLALLALHDGGTREEMTTPATGQRHSGPEHVLTRGFGSLVQEGNVSRFDVRPGIEAYPWHFFELSQRRRQVIEPGADIVHRRPRAGPESHELAAVMESSLAEIRRRTSDALYTQADALGGRYRLLPGAGLQYELYFRTRDKRPAGFHTVRVTRPLGLPRVQHAGSMGQQKINIILPYYNRLSVLQQFVSRFAALVKAKQELVLTVVRYSDGFPSMDAERARKDHEGVTQLVRNANNNLTGFGEAPRVRLLKRSGMFSRGGALMEGARAWNDTDDVLLFLCDVDMLFGKSFLQRCRANTAPARRAYFPVVFNTYNPDIVFDVIKKRVVPILTSYERNTLINRQMGYWIDFGFGMTCQYRSDFLRLSGEFFDIVGWGLEDSLLYNSFKDNNVEIVRMADPDLVHIYHKKQCNKHEVGKRLKSCLATKALNEASRLGWGLWVYKHMGDTDDIEEFLQVFRNAKPVTDGGG